MIDLTTIQIVSAIPEKILALESANQLILSDNQSLTVSNRTLLYFCITLGVTLAGIGLFLLIRHLNKKEEAIENRMPALNN